MFNIIILKIIRIQFHTHININVWLQKHILTLIYLIHQIINNYQFYDLFFHLLIKVILSDYTLPY